MIDTYGHHYYKEQVDQIKEFYDNYNYVKSADISSYLFDIDTATGDSYNSFKTTYMECLVSQTDYSAFIKIDPNDYKFSYPEEFSDDKELPDKDLSRIPLQLDLS